MELEITYNITDLKGELEKTLAYEITAEIDAELLHSMKFADGWSRKDEAEAQELERKLEELEL